MAFRFATKFGLEVLTGNALSAWLEFIDETIEKSFFVYQGSNPEPPPFYQLRANPANGLLGCCSHKSSSDNGGSNKCNFDKIYEIHWEKLGQSCKEKVQRWCRGG